LLRKIGYRILELPYDCYSDRKRDELYQEMIDCLGDPVVRGKVEGFVLHTVY